ncbi:MAG TPA: hypothetical protein VGJ95_07485 [Pseudonocardiaceae bacterium]
MFGPEVDRNEKHTLWADTYYSRGRIEIGCLVWGVLSSCFLVVGLIQHFPAWSLLVVFGGPLLLLMFLTRMPLADVPVLFVILASLGGIGWEFAANRYPPWTVGLIFVGYLFSYEEALSGLVKLRYLEAVARLRYDSLHRRRCDEDHLTAKRRIWGYLLATASSAAIFNGFGSGGRYHLVLLMVVVLAFLMRSRAFSAVLRWFSTSRFIGEAIDEGRRWPHVLAALACAAAFGLSLHWLVVKGSAFGGRVAGWAGASTGDGAWFNDLETIGIATMLWAVAALRYEWTS